MNVEDKEEDTVEASEEEEEAFPPLTLRGGLGEEAREREGRGVGATERKRRAC